MNFKCQMAAIDSDDDWFEIASSCAETAAEAYVGRCDRMSGGEILNKPLDDREVVRVKDEQNIVRSFEVSMDWYKEYYLHEMGVPH